RIKGFLPLRIRLDTYVFTVWGAKTEHGLNQFPALSSIPNVEGDKHDHLLAVDLLGKKRQRRRLTQDRPHVKLLRRGLNKFAVLCQHLLCLIERENDQPGQNFRPHLMKFEFELGDNPKIAATTSKRPKQVGVFVFACSDPLTVRSNDLYRDQVV